MPATPDASKSARRAVKASYQAIVRAGGGLEMLGVYADAWAALGVGGMGFAEIKDPALTKCRRWNGERKEGATLVVIRAIRHVGGQIRMARVVAQLARDSGLRITLCVEDRLVALFARSFPEITVRSENEKHDLLAASDFWASYEKVAQYVWPSKDRIAATFHPLRPDTAQTDALRARYAGSAGQRPVVGVSWHSTNADKQLPEVGDWRVHLQELECWGLSLQYHPEAAGLRHFETEGQQIMNVDPDIDARDDVDGLAAQIAATDIVITISNTTAHLAGALGHPCIIVLDDKEHLIWPRNSAEVCYYPSVTLVRKSGRPWPEVFRSVQALVQARLGYGLHKDAAVVAPSSDFGNTQPV